MTVTHDDDENFMTSKFFFADFAICYNRKFCLLALKEEEDEQMWLSEKVANVMLKIYDGSNYA